MGQFTQNFQPDSFQYEVCTIYMIYCWGAKIWNLSDPCQNTLSPQQFALPFIRTCWINPQCRSMSINRNQISGIDPKCGSIDHCLSIKINLIKQPLIQQWSALIHIDPHWSLLSKIYLYWSKLIGKDLYWDQFLNFDLYWSALIGIGDWSSMSWFISLLNMFDRIGISEYAQSVYKICHRKNVSNRGKRKCQKSGSHNRLLAK